MNQNHKKFLARFFKHGNGARAARESGLNPKSDPDGRRTAFRLLSENQEIKEAVEEYVRKIDIEAEEVLKRLAAIATGQLPSKTIEYSNGKTRTEYDYISALDKLGKYFGMFIDKVELQVEGLDIVFEEEDDEKAITNNSSDSTQ